MKCRIGFVSNSSSSSFVIITTKEGDFSNNPNLSEDIKTIYEDAFRCHKDKFDGKDVLIYTGYSSEESDISNSEEFRDYCEKNNISDDDSWELADELFNSFYTYFDEDKSIITWNDD